MSKPKPKGIPEDVIDEVKKRVEAFNREVIGDPELFYQVRTRGRHLYLDFSEHGSAGPICRLTYRGEIDNWDFAIYKYSDSRYDPEEWVFPGSQHVDGSVEGAMRAGLDAYINVY
jgi:hypothetical protein